MPTKRVPPTLEIEDASQLSILAYQVRTNRVVDLKRFLERLKSEHARRIAEAIAAGGTTSNKSIGDDTLKVAGYYLRWADDTANSARAASKRPPVSDRKGNP
jgi:hypothetical protein